MHSRGSTCYDGFSRGLRTKRQAISYELGTIEAGLIVPSVAMIGRKGAAASNRGRFPGSRSHRQSVMKSFLTACGVDDSLQLVVESQSANEGELRLLHQPFAVIGRDPRADVVLDHPQVSRRHVYLQVVEGRAFWVDLESRTGTAVKGSPRSSAGWRGDGHFASDRM